MSEVHPFREEEEKNLRPAPNMNVNRYATKKTIAQGMLDIALLTANASQLKYVLQVGKERHPFFTLMVTLISISIVLQVISGCLALSVNMLRDCRLHLPDNVNSALLLNYFQLGLSVGIAGVNIIISAFDPGYATKNIGAVIDNAANNVIVGVCFLFLGSLNINKPKSQRTADILNNMITIQIFIITSINVIISSFGIEHIIIEEDKWNRKSGTVRRDVPQIFETGEAIQLFANDTININSGRILFDEKSL